MSNNGIIDKLMTAFTCTIGVAILVGGALAIWPRYVQSRGLNNERARIKRRIEEKKKEIAEIRNKQRRFKTDREFVEKLARENKRVYPGELVFIFDD